MASFGMMNDSYYQPADDRAWDGFVDYCDSNGLNTDDEDFDQWVEDQHEAAAEAAAERDYDYERENRDEW